MQSAIPLSVTSILTAGMSRSRDRIASALCMAAFREDLGISVWVGATTLSRDASKDDTCFPIIPKPLQGPLMSNNSQYNRQRFVLHRNASSRPQYSATTCLDRTHDHSNLWTGGLLKLASRESTR